MRARGPSFFTEVAACQASAQVSVTRRGEVRSCSHAALLLEIPYAARTAYNILPPILLAKGADRLKLNSFSDQSTLANYTFPSQFKSLIIHQNLIQHNPNII